VGAGGTVFVLDGETIRMEFAGGQVRKVSVPSYEDAEFYADDEFSGLAVGGGYLAHVSRAGLAFSRDYGASWSIKDLPGGPDEIDLTLDNDGSFIAKLTFYNCHSGDYDELYRGSVEGPWEEIQGYVAWLGHSVGYDHSYDGGMVRIGKVDGDGESRPMAGEFSPDTFWPGAVVHNGQTDFALFGKQLYRLTPDKAVLLSSKAPQGFELHAVDGQNRLFGLAHHKLVIWTASGGFRQLEIVID
jgi:hypothetical protein